MKRIIATAALCAAVLVPDASAQSQCNPDSLDYYYCMEREAYRQRQLDDLIRRYSPPPSHFDQYWNYFN